jgi:hypothetical protein
VPSRGGKPPRLLHYLFFGFELLEPLSSVELIPLDVDPVPVRVEERAPVEPALDEVPVVPGEA